MLKPIINGDIPQPFNNPQLSAFLGNRPGAALDLGYINEEVGVVSMLSGEVWTPQGPENALMKFRAQFPFVPVIPFPPQVRTVMLAPNAPLEIEVPDMVEACMFRGSSDYYICNHGNASIPVVGELRTDYQSKSIYRPDGIMFFTGGIKAFSIIAPAACAVTLLGYAPTELPRYER